MKFGIDFSSVTFEVECFYETTKEFCKDYLFDGTSDNKIIIAREDLQNEHRLVGKQSILMEDEDAELLALQRKIANVLPRHGAFLIHGSAVSIDGKGFIYCAPSGTGKSTHTDTLCRTLGDRTVMINDDKPFIKFNNGSFFLCGSPWMGKHHIGTNISAPLCGICLLHRSKENEIKPIDKEKTFFELIGNIYRPDKKDCLALTLDLVNDLCKQVSVFEYCGENIDKYSVVKAYEIMRG